MTEWRPLSLRAALRHVGISAARSGGGGRHSRGILPTLLRWLGAGLGFLVRVVLVAWAGFAIFYSNLPWPELRLALALGFAGFAVWVFWLSRRWRMQMQMALAVLFLGVVVWWISIQPSLDRTWQPEVAVMPRSFIDGDRVRLTGVRDFDYRSLDDFTVRYEEREVRLSHLAGLDFYVSYWSKGLVGRLIGHTFLSFIFDDAPPLSVSIEARPEKGQSFDPLGSLFKQYELIYVVGEERDLVRVRTNYRAEKVHLYHLNTSAENARRLFLIYKIGWIVRLRCNLKAKKERQIAPERVAAKWSRRLLPLPTPIARAPTAVGYATTPGRTPTRAAAAPDLYDFGCCLRDDTVRQRCRVRRPRPHRGNGDHPNHCECSQLHPAPPSKTYRRLAGRRDQDTPQQC